MLALALTKARRLVSYLHDKISFAAYPDTNQSLVEYRLLGAKREETKWI